MNLKGFYQTAKQELEPLFGEVVDFWLEQVERDDKNGLWEVVVSFFNGK